MDRGVQTLDLRGLGDPEPDGAVHQLRDQPGDDESPADRDHDGQRLEAEQMSAGAGDESLVGDATVDGASGEHTDEKRPDETGGAMHSDDVERVVVPVLVLGADRETRDDPTSEADDDRRHAVDE